MQRDESSASSYHGSDLESSLQSGSSRSCVFSNDVSGTGPTFSDPTVICGMACRVPGATNTSQLWDVLAQRRDLRSKVPEERFNVDAFYHPQGTNKGTVCRYKLCNWTPYLQKSRQMPNMDTFLTKISVCLIMTFSTFPEQKQKQWIHSNDCY